MMIFQCSELRFRIRIIIRSSRSGETLRNTEQVHEFPCCACLHRRTAVIVDYSVVFRSQMLLNRFTDKILSAAGILAFRKHPTNHIPAENIYHHIKKKELSLKRSLEPGNIPTPYLVRRISLQNWSCVLYSAGLQPTFARFSVLCKNPVKCPVTAKIYAFIGKLGDNFPRCLVNKTVFVKNIQNFLPDTVRNPVLWRRTRKSILHR